MYAMKKTQRINKYISDLLLNENTSVDEQYVIFNLLLLIYGLRPGFISNYKIEQDFLKKLLKGIEGTVSVSDDFFYSTKNKDKKIIKDVLSDNNNHCKTGKALGYYCYKNKLWGDHFNSDRYIFKLRGYFNNDPFDIFLYNFACSKKETKLKDLKRYGDGLVKRYTTVLNSKFKEYGITFTFFYEIEFTRSVMYYLDKIKKKDQAFIMRNKSEYENLFSRVDYKKSKIYKMLLNLNNKNVNIVYEYLYYINSDEFLNKYSEYLLDEKTRDVRYKKFKSNIKELENLFIDGRKDYDKFMFG